MTDEVPSRRASDVQIPMLAAKVGQVEATLESQQRWMSDLDRKVDEGLKDVRNELGSKIDKLTDAITDKTRMPMLPFVTLLVVAGGFLLTIMTLVSNSQSSVIARVEHRLDAHDDGHPRRVQDIMEEKFSALVDFVRSVDKQHADENVEQEGDIEELRQANLRVEERNDEQDARLSVIETKVNERTNHFSKYIELRSQDRWTRTQDDDRYQAKMSLDDEVHRSMEQRLEDTRALIVGKKGGGFHQQHWKMQALPRLKSLEGRLDKLEAK